MVLINKCYVTFSPTSLEKAPWLADCQGGRAGWSITRCGREATSTGVWKRTEFMPQTWPTHPLLPNRSCPAPPDCSYALRTSPLAPSSLRQLSSGPDDTNTVGGVHSHAQGSDTTESTLTSPGISTLPPQWFPGVSKMGAVSTLATRPEPGRVRRNSINNSIPCVPSRFC